jgi:hypothetical protein
MVLTSSDALLMDSQTSVIPFLSFDLPLIFSAIHLITKELTTDPFALTGATSKIVTK